VRAALLLTAALLAACAHAPARPETVPVRAEGWAPLGPEGRAHARDRALADALRRAAEQGAGVVVEARSSVEKSVTLAQDVVTRARGVVRSWLVLGEREEHGILRLGIVAQVEKGRGLPERTVALSMTDARARAGVAKALAERGIAVDRRALRRVSGTAAARSLRVSVFPGTESFRASTELVDEQTSRTVFGEASALDVDPDLAAAKAIEAAGYKAGLALAESLASAP
jgi:hypothetical protein